MQTLISYVLASNSVGEFRSFDNDKNVDSPTFAIGLAFDWAIRLFHNANTEDALPIDSLQDVTNWSLQFKRANLPDETPLIVAEGCELSQVFDPLANITYTQVTAHLPVTNTEELQRLIDGEQSVTLEAELVGYDANSASVFVLQIPSVVWRNRAFASQPTPVTGWITTDMLGDAVVTAPKIGNGAVTTQKIANGAVLTDKIADNSVTAEKIDYLAVTTEKLDDSAVETDKIADGAVVEAKIGNGAVTAEKLGDFSVTSTKIEDYAVTADHIASSAVTNGKLASSAVTTDKIADSAVTAAKIAAGAVGSTQLASSAVGTGNIADSAVSGAKIGNGAVTAEKISAGAVGADAIASSAVTEAKISTGAVTAGKLADGSVGTAKISAGAVTGDKIANASVSSAKIAGGAVGTDKLADGSVTAPKIAANAVSAEKIMDGAVTESKLGDSSVSSSKLADSAVTSAKVADLSISTGKIALGAVGSSQLADSSVISTKIAAAAISTEKLADDSVTHAKLNHWTPITAINGNACTITAGDVIEWHLTGDGTMTATKQSGSYGQAKAEIFSNDKTITFNGITLVDALQPSQINFCTLDFIGNQCNLHVDHQVYGYVVTSTGGTSSGSLAYGINDTTEEYITFRSDMQEVELEGGTIARSVKIIGNGAEVTSISATGGTIQLVGTASNVSYANVEIGSTVFSTSYASRIFSNVHFSSPVSLEYGINVFNNCTVTANYSGSAIIFLNRWPDTRINGLSIENSSSTRALHISYVSLKEAKNIRIVGGTYSTVFEGWSWNATDNDIDNIEISSCTFINGIVVIGNLSGYVFKNVSIKDCQSSGNTINVLTNSGVPVSALVFDGLLVSNVGKSNISSGSTLNLTSGTFATAKDGINNSGTLNFSGVNILNGTVTNLAGGTIKLLNGGTISGSGTVNFGGAPTRINTYQAATISGMRVVGAFSDAAFASYGTLNLAGLNIAGNVVDNAGAVVQSASTDSVVNIAGCTISGLTTPVYTLRTNAGTTAVKDTTIDVVGKNQYASGGMFVLDGRNTIKSRFIGLANSNMRIVSGSTQDFGGITQPYCIESNYNISIGSYVDDTWVVGGTATIITSGGTIHVRGTGTYIKANGETDLEIIQ